MEGSRRGEYCQLDFNLAAIHPLSQASTVDHSLVLLLKDHHYTSEMFLVKRKEDLPSLSASAKVRMHLGLTAGHYCKVLERMSTAGMVRFLDAGSGVL